MIRLVSAPFDPGEALAAFCRDRVETGAVASFTGLARAEAGRTALLELEAYPGFTEKEIARHEAAARERFVFVATASAHRRAAFEACDFLMDYLKSRAPFWKKETGPEGARWIEPTGQDLDDLTRWERP